MRRSECCFKFRFAVLGAALFFSPMMMAGDRPTPQPDADTLTALSAYYGVSEDQVIERLAHEAEAARLYSQLPALLGEAYAGAWFDEESFKLKVGLTNSDDIAMVERLGATTVLFEHSLDYLEALQRKIQNARADNPEAFAGLVSLGVDYPSNQLALGVLPETQAALADTLASVSIRSADYRFHELAAIPELSSQIRGADCYDNPNFTFKGGPLPCSIGFSVDKGFITAGHCGERFHDVDSCGGSPMGIVQGSTWHSQPPGSRTQDSAWVDTVSPWQPVALVNGYSSGVLSITAEAGGFRESPTFSTVCRYGRTSGGPNCGQVQARNQILQMCSQRQYGICLVYDYIEGTTETNICVEEGDSGGPYLSGTGHAQGTTIGGFNGTCTGSVSSPPQSWFQPTADTLSTYSTLNLLTSHGSNPPAITLFDCPDAGNSGGGQYWCQMSYDTQGATTVQWTSNTGHSSSGEILFGSCGPSSTVNVSLTVTNPWGSAYRSASFPCPSGPLP